jgi:hypothetical protein
MRKVLSALAGGALVVMLSTLPAQAASPANAAGTSRSGQIEHHHRGGDDGDDGDRDRDRDRYDDHWHHCHHGIVGAVIHWLI